MSQLDLFAGARVEAPAAPAAHPRPELELEHASQAQQAKLDARGALAAVAEHIRNSSVWCQGCSARDAHGRPTQPEHAVRWSAYGALALLAEQGRVSRDTLTQLGPALDRAARESRHLAFARWHDLPGTSHADVLLALERAKENLR